MVVKNKIRFDYLFVGKVKGFSCIVKSYNEEMQKICGMSEQRNAGKYNNKAYI